MTTSKSEKCPKCKWNTSILIYENEEYVKRPSDEWYGIENDRCPTCKDRKIIKPEDIENIRGILSVIIDRFEMDGDFRDYICLFFKDGSKNRRYKNMVDGVKALEAVRILVGGQVYLPQSKHIPNTCYGVACHHGWDEEMLPRETPSIKATLPSIAEPVHEDKKTFEEEDIRYARDILSSVLDNFQDTHFTDYMQEYVQKFADIHSDARDCIVACMNALTAYVSMMKDTKWFEKVADMRQHSELRYLQYRIRNGMIPKMDKLEKRLEKK